MKTSITYKRVLSLVAMLLLVALPAMAFAAPELTATADKTSVTAGDTVVVTVTLAGKKLSAAEGDVIVVPGAVVPVWGEGNRAVYTADAALLRARLAEGLTLGDCPAEAEGVRQLWQSPSIAPSFLPVADAAALQAAMPAARELLMRRMAMNGVAVIDPNNTYVDPRCAVAPGVTLLPGTILRGHTVIGKGCEIGPNTMIRDCVVGKDTTVNASQLNESTIGSHTTVGPFAYVRPGCAVGDHCRIGDFVELKNSRLDEGTKVSHLTYVGDSDIGKRVNFGCGTVTTNYNGLKKFRCTVGDDVFLGCNTNLISPVTIGDGRGRRTNPAGPPGSSRTRKSR